MSERTRRSVLAIQSIMPTILLTGCVSQNESKETDTKALTNTQTSSGTVTKTTTTGYLRADDLVVTNRIESKISPRIEISSQVVDEDFADEVTLSAAGDSNSSKAYHELSIMEKECTIRVSTDDGLESTYSFSGTRGSSSVSVEVGVYPDRIEFSESEV